MATDNKGVTCYLPIELETALTAFCGDRGITRKDKEGNEKPSLGTGIIEALKIYFGIVPGSLPGHVSSSVPSNELLIDSIKEILPGLLPSQLPGELLTRDELTRSIESLRSELLVK